MQKIAVSYVAVPSRVRKGLCNCSFHHANIRNIKECDILIKDYEDKPFFLNMHK